MPRKTRRPAEFRVPTGVARPVLWPRLLLTALLSAALGAGITYAVLRPALRHAAAVRSQTPVNTSPPASQTGSASASPPPELTANLAPDKAAVALGNWYEDHKQWAQAIASYTQAINSGLDNPDVRTDLGFAYNGAGQPQNALVQFQTAQQQDPTHENSLFDQGVTYAMLGSAPNAIKTWRTYIKRFPQGQHVADARQLIAQITLHGGQVPFTPNGGSSQTPFTPAADPNSPSANPNSPSAPAAP